VHLEPLAVAIGDRGGILHDLVDDHRLGKRGLP
jgi:hypothetical protein